MQKNDKIELFIEDIGVDGEGIGKYEGMAFFVKDAVVGDRILARITKLKKNYGYARVEKIIESSPFRVSPECKHHRRCGGCQIQTMDYNKQLEFKQRKVKDSLMRLGGFLEAEIDKVMEPIVGMDYPFRYRNKAQVPIGADKNAYPVAGFYAARTHEIIPMTDCKLGAPVNQLVLEVVLSYMRENQIAPYDESTRRGLVRHVLIRYGFTTKELMVCLIINGKKLPSQEKLIEQLKKIDGMTSISVNQNMKDTNVILGDVTETIWGKAYITDYIHLRSCFDERMESNHGASAGRGEEFALTDTAIAYHISPQSFYQVNPVQTEKLYSLALSYAGLTGRETVWDLYCGIGTISLFLAQRAGKVCGVEIVPQAIADAKSNARLNGITNVEFFVGKAEEVLPQFYENNQQTQMLHPDVIVVDPPRKGCDEKCLETMIKMQPKRIVYVSCDPATLARDLRVLCDGGYEVKRVRPVDMFPGTVHVETVVMLSHKKPDSVINVKVEFGEGEGKVPLDNIAKRAEAYKPKERVTYKMIKEYIEAKYGFKVHTAYIAEVKRESGLPMHDAPNAVEELKQPRKHPTPEKIEAIKDALKHFSLYES